MKLSQLEQLVKAMREHATENGIADPSVDYWVHPNAASVLDIYPDVGWELDQHVVEDPGRGYARGDYQIPLVVMPPKD